MATKCLSGSSFYVRILPGCRQGQHMGCQGGTHEKGSCWDNSEKSYKHPTAGMCSEQTVEPWGWLSEDDRDEWRSGLWSTAQKPWVWALKGVCSVLGIRATLGIVVNVSLWQNTHGKNSRKEELTLGLSFGGFCPWLADVLFLDCEKVDRPSWLKGTENWVAHFLIAKKPKQTEPPSFNHLLLLDRAAETQSYTTQSLGVCFLPKWKQERGCWSRRLVSL